jgi:N-glycosylase/DNA lyase
MKNTLPRITIGELHRLYAHRKAAVVLRLNEFSRVPQSEYFYELAYCMLTPQSSAAHAEEVVNKLKQCDFFNNPVDPIPLLRRKDHYIRFHNTKGRHLIEAKGRFRDILHHLSNGAGSEELREWLVTNVRGIGYKEASHFLRNIGHRDLAILDRHILKNLRRFAVLRSIPQTLTRKRYMAIERKFRSFSKRVGIPMDELDLLFWSLETGKILK